MICLNETQKIKHREVIQNSQYWIDDGIGAYMSIDLIKVKNFWDSQAAKYCKIPLESISNLEENQDLLKIKVEHERNKIFDLLFLTKDMSVLDLGAGVGNWSCEFAKNCKKVYAVEYSKKLIDIAKLEAKKKGINNIKFIHESAQDFSSEEKFDLIFISGLLIYLNDEDLQKLVSNIPSYSKFNSQLLL